MSVKVSIAYIICCLLVWSSACAQFAPAAGWPGTTALPADTSLFTSWATMCQLQRGYLDIATPDSGFVTFGDEVAATGKAGENGFVSLGDGGIATLTFSAPIMNGEGYDFAVFENGFLFGAPGEAFLEFAFVEVSSDGVNFYRFPATSHLQDTVQIPMTGINCALVNNLAGKYVYGFGTPFDLEDVKNVIGLDANSITHVRIVDVIGTVNNTFASLDMNGRKINDPYPTPFPSGGFDLDAVGVIHSLQPSAQISITNNSIRVYPNPVPALDDFNISLGDEISENSVSVVNSLGSLVYKNPLLGTLSRISTTGWMPGLYFVLVGNQTFKLVVE
ncbi:MAG: T9SS type A sorting domain-containing protein [Bacteroidetes bacterium]|nr:T9SS type A sorting domain-containing protein [Bacteroidota bacterium]